MLSLEKENILHAGPQLQLEKAGQRKLAPKTPMQLGSQVPKTPFRMPLDRENMETTRRAFTARKSIDPSAFITPVGPRRVPLGGKTTNAKAPISEQKGKLQLKLQSPHPKTMIGATEEETTDIEYMPPRPDDLPDIPDDFIALDYNLLKNNIFSGVYSYYLDAYDENGKTKLERQMDARMEELDREMIAEADGITLPKYTASKKSIAARKDISTVPPRAASRPVSEVGRQTSTEVRWAVPTSGARSKTPAEASRPLSTTKSSSTTTGRLTSRVRSRPTSRANSSSTPTVTKPNKPRTGSSAPSPNHVPLASYLNRSVVRPDAGEGTSAIETSDVGVQENMTLIQQSWEFQLSKTLQEDEEEAIKEFMYATNSDGDERLGIENIPFDDADSLFQL